MARPLTVQNFGTRVVTATKKFGTGSCELDGTDDYLRVLNVPEFEWGQSDYTIELWIYTDARFPDEGDDIIGFFGPSEKEFYLRISQLAGTYPTANISFFTNNFTGYTTQIAGPATLSYGNWHHLAIVRNGNSLNLYVNGSQIASESITSPDHTGVGDLYIGTNGRLSNRDVTGYIDEIRISNTARYTSSFTPSSSAFLNDNNTLLLVHCDGTLNQTTFSDDFPVVTGNAELISTATIQCQGNYVQAGRANLEAFGSQMSLANPSPSMVYLQNDVFTWENTDTWDTIYDSDDKWAVWERLNSSFAITAIGSDFDIASSSILFEANLSVSGGIQRNGSADLTNTADLYAKAGFLVGIDDPYDYTWETVPEDQWNGFFTDQWRPNGWFAFDAVTLTGSGGLALVGQANLTSTAAMAADARLSDVRGSADLAGQFALQSGSDNFKDGSATLEAFATEVTVGRLSDVRGSADLVGEFALQSGSDLYRSGSSTLEAEANLASSGAMTVNARADLAGEFVLESNSRILKLANLDITSLGDMTVTAQVQSAAKVNLDANFDLQATAGYSIIGQSQLAAEFTQTVHATLIPSVELDEVAFNADLTVDAVMVYGAGARLEAFATELTAGERLPGGKATITAEFSTVVTGSAVFGGSARLEAFASELVAGRISTTRGSASLAGTFVAEFAGELKLLDSQFIYKVLSDTRTFAVESEQRTYDVLSENRIFGIEQESRGYQVLPENRTVDVGYLMQ